MTLCHRLNLSQEQLNNPTTTEEAMLTALACLATAIYFEARGEPTIGQLAVAQVIMTRVNWHQNLLNLILIQA